MLRLRHPIIALALLVAVGACSDDDGDNGTEPTPLAALVGSYTTQSFKYTAVANPELTIDLATLGAGITALTVNADGTFSGSATLEIDGEFTTIDADGTLTNVTSSSLTINFEGVAALVLPNPLPVAYTLSGSVLSFVANNINFDFGVIGGPPGETPTTLEVVLLRN
jgi:hypothetical protein